MTDDQKRAVIAAVQENGVIGLRDDALEEAEHFVEMAQRAKDCGVYTPAVVAVLAAAGIEVGG